MTGTSALPRGRAARYQAVRQCAAAGLLAAACVSWAALPPRAGLSTAAVVLAAGCALLTVARLASGTALPGPSVYLPALVRAGRALLLMLRSVPWAEGMVIAVLAAEAAHPSRPYHTGVLGAGLLAFLFAVHLAESDTPPRLLRPQLPLIAAGLGLLVLATGASLLAVPAGTASAWYRVLAVIAAVLAGALALPV
ncbi:MAG TPA: hypothetical protein VH637_01980 [Streptosporangiaceae bacterium]